MKQVKNLLTFLGFQRRGGTTTLIEKIASENDCWIVVRFHEDVKRSFPKLKEKCITIDQLESFRELPKKPVLFETPAIKELLERAMESYEGERNTRQRFNAALLDIKRRISDLENGGDILNSK